MSNLNVLPLRHHRETPSWSAGVATQIAPRRNGLLAALSVEDYERLLPELKPVELVAGSTIYDADEREGYLYFLTSGIVARFLAIPNGASAAVSVTGSEGVVGIASLLGGQSTRNRAVVLNPGYAYRLPGDFLEDEVRHNSPLLQVLLRYTLALIAQTAQVVACNRRHAVEQQICRWILTCLDRAPAGELGMTQQLMADMLGVRRESVTEGAARLQAAGLIQYSRGKIAVLDRAQLERRACECYAVIRKESARLLWPETLKAVCEARLPTRIIHRDNATVF